MIKKQSDFEDGMFSNVKYMGKLLTEWQKELNNQFTLGELYKMAMEGKLSAYWKG